MKVINEQVPAILTELIEHINNTCENEDAKKIFEKCILNGYQTTFDFEEGKTFVVTGDIEAMWYRDSVCQMLPYLKFVDKSTTLKAMCRGLVETHKENLINDPYANAFMKYNFKPSHRLKYENIGNGPKIWERKFELDSISFPLDFMYKYYMATKDDSIFDENFHEMMCKLEKLFELEQDHFKNSMYRFYTLENYGLGKDVDITGMVWSSHRPSDDEQIYGYLVPSNLYLVKCLEQLISIHEVLNYDISNLIKVKEDIKHGIEKFGVVNHEQFGDIYAYEVDGIGNVNLMDDANMPSLLSLPYLGICENDDEIYANTRKFILSKENKYYYEGKFAKGIGSPHTHIDEVWPIALAMEYFSENNADEKERIFNTLCSTHADTYLMHEAFNVDNPYEYSREWFGWSNAMFIEVMISRYVR